MGWSFDLLTRLSEAGVDFVIIGGVAAVTHGSAQMTEDLDTLIAAKRFAGREKDRAALRELEVIRQKLAANGHREG